MEINKKYKIELAASDDPTRLVLMNPQLEDNVIVATDGRILAVVPICRQDGDTNGPVPRAALIAARKGNKKDAAWIALNGSAEVPKAGQTFNREGMDCTYPNWRQVIPAKDRPGEMTIGLDACLLWRLAQAIGSEGPLVLRIAIRNRTTTQPIIVNGLEKDDSAAYGVIMPRKV